MAAESLPLRPPFGGLEPGSPTDLTRCYSLPMAENVKNTEGRSRTTVSSKHQVTIPKPAMRQAGLRAGDRLRAVVSGAAGCSWSGRMTRSRGTPASCPAPIAQTS